MNKNTHDYKTITFRLDMNNSLEQQLFGELEKNSIKVRNRLIKDALIRQLIINNVEKSENMATDNSGMNEMLAVIYDKIENLEKRMNRELSAAPAESKPKAAEPLAAPSKVPEPEVIPEETKDISVEPDEPSVSEEALAFLANGGFM